MVIWDTRSISADWYYRKILSTGKLSENEYTEKNSGPDFLNIRVFEVIQGCTEVEVGDIFIYVYAMYIYMSKMCRRLM
jgi:hypothetical protein